VVERGKLPSEGSTTADEFGGKPETVSALIGFNLLL
jgi:hypothetical protein